ncbi:hypothetical protein RD792_014431 [Penstemon davidsonii]|uniref:GHMP kinase C-terminal domain-containing protein n=1 Tax=Penstemon davidsonii TaxID=160366 RepID=A0ABR0CPB5_9LAMI|nr:hypothetical protein RD792_014431 [Penstemon davidsonii]
MLLLQLNVIRTKVAEMSGRDSKEVKVVASPYRICPLGAHIDHQGGIVSAMTIDKGILLGFVPSDDSQVLIQSGQFNGELRFSSLTRIYLVHSIDEPQLPRSAAESNNSDEVKSSSSSHEECTWGSAGLSLLDLLILILQGIIGFISGAEGLDSSGLSSSAAVGVAYLLAFESANNVVISPSENIEYDRNLADFDKAYECLDYCCLIYILGGVTAARLIENEYLDLKNGILDQSAILLSSYGCLTCMNCKTKEYILIRSPELNGNHTNDVMKKFKILLAFSGLKQALTTNPGYNRRVAECREAANILLQASGSEELEPLLSNVEPEAYEKHKDKLDPNLARRAEHYFSENKRVLEGLEAWESGNLEKFGKLISASGLSSIQNYESGCEPLIQLYEILLKAPGMYGARFSGAGFRGCCIAFVDADKALDAASFVQNEYRKIQPELASQICDDGAVLICDAGDCARVI